MAEIQFQPDEVSSTRRTVVKTGAKLAYAAPLVAMTMHSTVQSAFAISGPTLNCDDLSPKQNKSTGISYTCKAPQSGSGCGDSTRDGDDQGSIQVEVGFGGSGPYCYCNSNIPPGGCYINGQFFPRNGMVSVCQPVDIATVNCS